jgi:hypothetical protein
MALHLVVIKHICETTEHNNLLLSVQTRCRLLELKSQNRQRRRQEKKATDGTETVERSPLALEGVDDIERRYRLALGVFGVCDRVTDHVLEKDLRQRGKSAHRSIRAH